MPTEPIRVLLCVIDALDDLGVLHIVGGSFAAAVHGVIRATQDADIVADLKMEHVEPFVEALKGQFYVEADAIRDAIQTRSSFNLVHLETLFKVDVFVSRQRKFDERQMERRSRVTVAVDPERFACFATAEDTLLAKLEWYRLGGEVSDRQWQDVLGILKVQGERLDLGYLREWSVTLGVSDLLQKALTETGLARD